MILTSTGNSRDFEKVATALMLQHPSRGPRSVPAYAGQSTTNGKGGKYRRKGRSGGKGKWRPRFAGMTLNPEEQYYEDESGQCWYIDEETGTVYPYHEEQGAYDQAAHPDAQQQQQQQADQQDEDYQHDAEDYDYDQDCELVESESEAIALNCVTDYLSYEGASIEEVPDEVAQAVQHQVVALSAMQKGTQGKTRRGKGRGRRGKGSGGGLTGKGQFPVRRHALTLSDRRAALKRLKLRTKCLKCGQLGHWQGDPECPKGGKGKV